MTRRHVLSRAGVQELVATLPTPTCESGHPVPLAISRSRSAALREVLDARVCKLLDAVLSEGLGAMDFMRSAGMASISVTPGVARSTTEAPTSILTADHVLVALKTLAQRGALPQLPVLETRPPFRRTPPAYGVASVEDAAWEPVSSHGVHSLFLEAPPGATLAPTPCVEHADFAGAVARSMRSEVHPMFLLDD